VIKINIFIGDTLRSAVLRPFSVDSFKDFCFKYLNNPFSGEKDGPYFTTADEVQLTVDHYRRNNATHSKSWVICIDGDKSVGDDESCVPLLEVHNILVKCNINHAIYSSYSHNAPYKHKWRLVVPCVLFGVEQHRKTVAGLYALLYKNGCKKLVVVRESLVLSQFWYLPRTYNLDRFEYYDYHKGNDFVALEAYPQDWDLVPKDFKGVDSGIKKTISGRKEADMLAVLITGSSPLHATMNDYIYGKVKDGYSSDRLNDHMIALTSTWNMKDKRLKERSADISRLVETATAKFSNEHELPSEWNEEKEEENMRIYTRYPDQGGWFEYLVENCMLWMPYPNRPIAILACHSLVSVLGGRVYTFAEGGIVLTAQLTGRSTIGKSFVKGWCTFALDQCGISLAKVSSRFTGSSYYTSVKNIVYELTEKESAVGSILSIRTESGQTDKSTAGDMGRVMAAELEMSTASGRGGYISSGGQNEKVPALYSPACTTIRESVAETQQEADMVNSTSISGKEGRQSRVLADGLKPFLNENRLGELPPELLEILKSMYAYASDERRKDVKVAMPEDLWIDVLYEDKRYFMDKCKGWTTQENIAAKKKDHYVSTFFGRLGVRLPAYAARLAIMDNAHYPVITKLHIDIAEASLIAEISAFYRLKESGELDGPWAIVISKLVDSFQGDMTQRKSFLPSGKEMLKEGAVKWKQLRRVVEHREEYKLLSKQGYFHRQLDDRLKAENIHIVNEAEALSLYKTAGKVYRRGK
jgi:hypothetical protein